MRPPEPDFFEAIPVSDKVNKVANIGPELHEPGTSPPKPEPQPAAIKQARTAAHAVLAHDGRVPSRRSGPARTQRQRKARTAADRLRCFDSANRI